MSVVRALCVGAVLLAGCSTVYTTRPMGDEIVAVVAKDWDGVWIAEDGAATIQVTDESQGTLLMGWIEKGEGLKLESHEVQLRSSGGWIFASTKAKDDPARYVWARVIKEEDRIIAWAPDASKFGDLVEEGLLPGVLEGKLSPDVFLGELTPEHMKLITSSSRGVLLEWEEPGIIRRAR